EPRAQSTDLGAVGADFPQQARLSDGTAPPEEPVVEKADAFSDGAVEAPHALDRRGDGGGVHLSDYSQIKARPQATTRESRSFSAFRSQCGRRTNSSPDMPPSNLDATRSPIPRSSRRIATLSVDTCATNRR